MRRNEQDRIRELLEQAFQGKDVRIEFQGSVKFHSDDELDAMTEDELVKHADDLISHFGGSNTSDSSPNYDFPNHELVTIKGGIEVYQKRGDQLHYEFPWERKIRTEYPIFRNKSRGTVI